MKTVLTTDPNEAAEFIKNGGVAAFPTETVYGLGANVFDEQAITKIFAAKRRPPDNPLIAHISDLDQLQELASSVNDQAKGLIDAFFPGPLTLVLPKADGVPAIAAAGLDTIGVRMPKSSLAHEFLKACGVPVSAPSANLSGRPSPTTWQAVFEDLDGRIDCILQGEATEIGLESTVVDCTGEVPMILRAGSVSITELRQVVAETAGPESGSAMMSRSPGTRHQHYSPKARVVVVDSVNGAIPSNSAYIGVDTPEQSFAKAMVCKTVEEYAHSFFEFFRECDRRGIDNIYCQTVSDEGIGAALMDRLRRAAEAN